MNLANLNRYKILKDKTVRMDNILSWNDASGSGTYAAGNKLVKFNLRFKRPIRVEFNSVNGGTYLDIVDRSFHMMFHAPAGAPDVIATYTCRFAYRDV